MTIRFCIVAERVRVDHWIATSADLPGFESTGIDAVQAIWRFIKRVGYDEQVWPEFNVIASGTHDGRIELEVIVAPAPRIARPSSN